MNDFDKINNVYYEEKLLFYDVFWIKGKNKVYILAPLFLVGWNGSELDGEYPIAIKANNTGLYPGKELIEELFITQGEYMAEFKTFILGNSSLLFVVDVMPSNDDLVVEINYKIRGRLITKPFTLSRNSRDKLELAAANLTLDENDVFDDWLHYHSMAGVDHFLLYDNGTKDLEELHAITSKYNCTIIPWGYTYSFELPEGWKYYKCPACRHIFGCQNSQQNHNIYKYCESFDWIAYNDADEYLYPIKHNGIKAHLDISKAYAVVNNVFHRTDGDSTLNRIYDRFIIREPIISVPVEHKYSPPSSANFIELHTALSRAKIIFNVGLLEDGDIIGIHIVKLVNKRDYHIFSADNELRLNHYRKTLHYMGKEVNDSCIITDDSFSEYVKQLEGI